MKNATARGPLVLVVDDDITIRILARESLEQAGFEVEEAENGLFALSALERFQPDIVLLDVVMPEMDGFSVCANLRSRPEGSLLPVLMMTGMDDSASINRAYEVGATDFITKPINWLILKHRVQYMLRANSSMKDLVRSEEKNRALLGAIPDLMFQVSEDGTILDFKAAKDFQLLMSASDYIYKNVRDVFPPDVATQTEKYMKKTFETGEGQTFEYQIFHGSDQQYYEARVVVCGDHEALTIVRNITDQKQAEEEKKRLEGQLQQAQKMQALGTLTSGIAHDFNNLLMGVQGHLALMSLNASDKDSDDEHVQKMEKIVQKGSALTKQLLGFARGQKGEACSTDLNDLIEESSEMFGRTKKEIAIRKQYERALWTVEVDRGQIEQVLLNLYVNAWHAMPSGGDLYLQTENVTIDQEYAKPFNVKPGRYVKIGVTDTGEGMDEETRQRIFEPFFTTKVMGKGSGLGLASAYGIIKNHGGIINVYSEKGEGTTFTIYLPALQKEVKEEEAVAAVVLRGNETILLVDDEDMIIEVGERMLASLGYTVLLARSGEEALDVYQRNGRKIDMIVLDMILPDMNGKEIYKRLKEANPDIKVLFASGYSMNNQTIEIVRGGCNGFIQKPYTMPQISQSIRKLLDRQAG
jgi:CheY-like chemotaxis protein